MPMCTLSIGVYQFRPSERKRRGHNRRTARTVAAGVTGGLTAATVGIIYGYDLSNIAGALLFITDEFGLTTRQQELVTTAVVIGEIAGALIGGGGSPTRSAARSRWCWWRPPTRHSRC